MRILVASIFCLMIVLVPHTMRAQGVDDGERDRPFRLEELIQRALDAPVSVEEESAEDLNVRRQAMVEAALSYGARGGLSWRTWHIQRELQARARHMDNTFDFRQLLIQAPSGLLLEPPIINENQNALIIEGDGQAAAVSDLHLEINRKARIVSAAKDWRHYLMRDWQRVELPSSLLLPQNGAEKDIWAANVVKGWNEGVAQADETFESDLHELSAHFQGMVRYRSLLAQGMISPPYALLVNRGVTGGGQEMRVGDRAVQITGQSLLQPEASQWQPANR